MYEYGLCMCSICAHVFTVVHRHQKGGIEYPLLSLFIYFLEAGSLSELRAVKQQALRSSCLCPY